MQTFARVLLWISGLGMLGFGLAFLWAPLATMAAAGLVLEGALASTELRAFYGGLEVALGLLMIACAMRPGRLRDGLVLSLAIYGSIGLARLSGMLISGADTPFLRFALATELGLALAAAIRVAAQTFSGTRLHPDADGPGLAPIQRYEHALCTVGAASASTRHRHAAKPGRG